MATNYFRNFPVIQYSGKQARNLTLRVKVLERVKNDDASFYFYNVRDGDRPDSIANDYYGDSRLQWLVLLANDIIDPYYDWPLAPREFDAFIANKYGSVPIAQAQILHYKKEQDVLYFKIADPTVFITETEFNGLTDKSPWTKADTGDDILTSPSSWNLMTGSERTGFVAVFAYDHEFDENESKRDIRLLRREFAPLVQRELQDLLNG